ncbi:MAG: hypothetical protein ABI777_07360 [Betaproteobacteria bacterium]
MGDSLVVLVHLLPAAVCHWMLLPVISDSLSLVVFSDNFGGECFAS